MWVAASTKPSHASVVNHSSARPRLVRGTDEERQFVQRATPTVGDKITRGRVALAAEADDAVVDGPRAADRRQVRIRAAHPGRAARSRGSAPRRQHESVHGLGELLDVSGLLLCCRARLADHTVHCWEDAEVLRSLHSVLRPPEWPCGCPGQSGTRHNDEDKIPP